MATDGFVRLPNWLIDDSALSGNELLVYVVLLRFRDPGSGKCFPGMTTIADRARLSRRSVMRAIESLEGRGMVKVDRRSTITDNRPNVYTVALATETPRKIWETSARGTRVPKRTPSDSESLPKEEPSTPSDSESLPSDNKAPAPVTPSHPKKIQVKKIQEQAMRRTLPSTPDNLFSFDEVSKATEKQISYLSDLYIFITERIPESRTRAHWDGLSTTEATELIGTYWKQIDRGRGGMWVSPVDETHSAFRALSPLGKRWVRTGCVPETLEAA